MDSRDFGTKFADQFYEHVSRAGARIHKLYHLYGTQAVEFARRTVGSHPKVRDAVSVLSEVASEYTFPFANEDLLLFFICTLVVFLTVGVLALLVLLVRALSGRLYATLAVVSGTTHRDPDRVLLMGLGNSGKTALLCRICGVSASNTQTSLEANTANITVGSRKLTLIDIPGSQIDTSLYPALATAGRLLIVLDSTTTRDDKALGVRSLAASLFEVFQSAAFVGVSSVCVAVNKRDQITSFTARTVRRELEAELKFLIDTAAKEGGASGGGIGILHGEVSKKVGKSAMFSERSDKAVLFTDSDGQFNFDTCMPLPVEFIDISATEDLGIDKLNIWLEL